MTTAQIAVAELNTWMLKHKLSLKRIKAELEATTKKEGKIREELEAMKATREAALHRFSESDKISQAGSNAIEESKAAAMRHQLTTKRGGF